MNPEELDSVLTVVFQGRLSGPTLAEVPQQTQAAVLRLAKAPQQRLGKPGLMGFRLGPRNHQNVVYLIGSNVRWNTLLRAISVQHTQLQVILVVVRLLVNILPASFRPADDVQAAFRELAINFSIKIYIGTDKSNICGTGCYS